MKIRHHCLVVTLSLSALLLAFCIVAEAQQPKKVPQIGYLSLGGGMDARAEAFRNGLREIGYLEGQNIRVFWRFAKGKADLLPVLASELVLLKVNVIVAEATRAIQAAKQATSTIPIVFPAAGDPVAYRLVESLAHPGGNITGLTMLSLELSGKRLELLKETLPGITRIAVLHDPDLLQSLKETESAAQSFGLKVQPLEIGEKFNVESAFALIKTNRAEAVITLPPPAVAVHQRAILDLLMKSRLPGMHSSKSWVERGGLMSYGPDTLDNDRRAAILVDKILKGAKPADLPIEQPRKFELVINLKTAKQIGLNIPPNVLARADRVIK